MKTAADYPISFPYGATTDPYSPAHPHRGDDRACPVGTPVVINGITIGLTGATGKVDGPHLHIQEWQGNYLNVRKPQNAFKGGTVVNIDLLGTQGDRSFGKFIDVKTDDGWTNSYCHLSSINVKVGDKLQGEQPMTQQEATAILDAFFGRFTGRKIKQSELDEYVPVLMSGYPDNFFKKAVDFEEIKNTIGAAHPTELGPGLYSVK